MFFNYLNNDAEYQKKFLKDFYYSGDQAFQDRDGYFWFIGRGDDIINTAEHLISPFEIESALLELQEVAESAAIDASDGILFEKVVVYICLKSQYKPSTTLN